MIRPIRVAVLAAGEVRRRGLAALVEAAGHEVVAGAPEVLLADDDALPAHAALPPVPVVALGSPDAATTGIAGKLPAAPSARQIDAALRAAAAGLEVRVPSRRPGSGFRAADDAPPLTPRESEILSAIGLGLSNKEVARRLGISAHTVKFHLEAAFRKLGAASRAEAVAKGLRQGLIEA